jgi:thioredoxin-related protein
MSISPKPRASAVSPFSACSRRSPGTALRRRLLLAAAAAPLGVASPAVFAGKQSALERPRSLAALLAAAERDGRPVVALFSLAGCGFCEAIRRDQLGHLAREAADRGVRVAEFDIGDDRPFEVAPAGATPLAGAASPARLARSLGVRVAPTVLFLSARGEVAPPLVGYSSPDFYGAYLDDRIEQARAALRSSRGG